MNGAETISSRFLLFTLLVAMNLMLSNESERDCIAAITEVSNWRAAFPEDEQKRTKRAYPEIEKTWDEKYGDRLNQIVFIGKNFDPQQVEKRLRMCLCTGVS